jgi:hypothetical protein
LPGWVLPISNDPDPGSVWTAAAKVTPLEVDKAAAKRRLSGDVQDLNPLCMFPNYPMFVGNRLAPGRRLTERPIRMLPMPLCSRKRRFCAASLAYMSG